MPCLPKSFHQQPNCLSATISLDLSFSQFTHYNTLQRWGWEATFVESQQVRRTKMAVKHAKLQWHGTVLRRGGQRVACRSTFHTWKYLHTACRHRIVTEFCFTIRLLHAILCYSVQHQWTKGCIMLMSNNSGAKFKKCLLHCGSREGAVKGWVVGGRRPREGGYPASYFIWSWYEKSWPLLHYLISLFTSHWLPSKSMSKSSASSILQSWYIKPCTDVLHGYSKCKTSLGLFPAALYSSEYQISTSSIKHHELLSFD